MNKELKILSAVFVCLVTLVSLAVFVSAASDDYDIDAVYIEGISLDSTGDTAINAELGEEVEVKVVLTGNPGGEYVDGVKVKAWIGGYEYGDMEDTTGSFDVEEDVTYVKKLNLELPTDLDVCGGDYSNYWDEGYADCTFTLYVEVYDDDYYERMDYGLFLERERHNIEVVDIVYSNTEAGDLTKVEVRLENLGDMKEEDIKVSLAIPELGVSEAVYLDELASPEIDNEDEESSESVFLYLEIPDDAKEGYYELELDVEYSRGHELIQDSYSLYVNSADEEKTIEEETTTTEEDEGKVSIRVDVDDKSVNIGEEAVYTVTFTNTMASSKIFTIDVLGEDQWGTSEVSPSVILVGADSTEEATVTVIPTEAGDYTFTLQILDEDGELMEEAEVDVSAESSSLFGGNSAWLKILFVVVVIIIIIIILVVAFRKMGDDDEDYDLDSKEGQTYY
ncbi:MAG: hypothetical protein ABIJ18_01775 [archaeon]